MQLKHQHAVQQTALTKSRFSIGQDILTPLCTMISPSSEHVLHLSSYSSLPAVSDFVQRPQHYHQNSRVMNTQACITFDTNSEGIFSF